MDTLTDLATRDVGGWEWKVVRDGIEFRYRTDSDCEGLWIWVEDGPSAHWRQLKGHLQAKYPKNRGQMLLHLKREGVIRKAQS